MAGFDAESYLRLIREQWAREAGQAGRLPRNPLLAAALAALVAVDVTTIAAARALVTQYDPALTSGSAHSDPSGGEPGQSGAATWPAVGRLRVVPCERVLDAPGGRLTIHYVAFTEPATTLRVTLDLDAPAECLPRGHPVPASARRLSVTDSRGTTATAELFGGHRNGDRTLHGQYEVRPQLAPDTAWIELLGERLELTARPAGISTWVERLPALDPAVRHLWERVATLNDFHDPHLALEATITTLTAAGALETGNPVIGQARAVLAVLRPGPTDLPARPEALAEPWQSLLARWGHAGGPVRTIAVGAVTPPFDGVTAAVIGLESRDDHFRITVELTPGVRTGLPYADLPDEQHLTWWAVDNRGNYHLGEQGSWDPGVDRSRGAILFWPALDPRASSIDLLPTATAQRAVVRVPLRKRGRPAQARSVCPRPRSSA